MNYISEKHFIPFGSQYYRAPSPYEENWEKDLRNMAQYGFNMVKFWVQWRWNNPSEDYFYFDDTDRLMDLAQLNGLKVMLNTIFDVAPAWIYRKYPDASMVTLSGRKIAPQTQPHRQIGGLGYCFNHDGVMAHFFQFLAETVKRYRDHPALAIWNVGSEPELTSSMAEMRVYADDAQKMGDMLCYCENCRRKFKGYLKEKYEEIDKLNNSWNRNYSSFDEVELPLTRNTFNDLIDWRMFFVHTLGENVKKRFEIAREIDQEKHPLMCHHVFIQGFPVTSTASDPWNVGRFGDLHGFTQMDDPMMIDMLRSCARGKPVISAEMLMLPGYTLDLPPSIDSNDIKRFIFSGIAGNLKGFVFWQYRPEILGREAPTWGLTTLDGKETPWLKHYANVGNVIQKHKEFLSAVEPLPARAAVLYHPENQIFGWAATGNEKNVTDSLLGAHWALYENNITVDFIHPDEIDTTLLNRYQLIILPFPYIIGRQLADELKTWVANGGLLIAEAYLAGWNREAGRHATVVPGYGLDEVFQACQGVVDPVPLDEGIEIKILKSSLEIQGCLVQTRLVPRGADVLGSFPDGSAAVTLSTFGKGKALQFGSYVFMPSYRNKTNSVGKFLMSLVKKYTSLDIPEILSGVRIRIDRLKNSSGKNMLIFRNLTDNAVETSVSIPELKPCEIKEIFSDQKITGIAMGNGSSYQICLQPREVTAYRD